jgi:hypothetical protein
MANEFSTKGAQYDSPGQRPGFVGVEDFQALKGRHKRRFALSGLDGFLAVEPRALPWAVSLRPVGAGCDWFAESLSLDHTTFKGLSYGR